MTKVRQSTTTADAKGRKTGYAYMSSEPGWHARSDGEEMVSKGAKRGEKHDLANSRSI